MHQSFKRLLVVVGLIFSGTLFTAAAPLPVDSFQKEPDGLVLHLKPGVMKLEVCTDRIVHVVYSPTENLPTNHSYVVTAAWALPQFSVVEETNWVGVRTLELEVRVDRASGAVSFLDAKGGVLLQEPAEGGKLMTPVRVNQENSYQPQQSFVSPPDEWLYGLGQYQDGLWNWRGLPRQFRQVNTQIVLPMLVSTRGYGLLWDNASLTDFNPPEQQVVLDPTNRTGTFTTGAAGDYVFYVKDVDLRDEVGIQVDGQVVARVTNYWVPCFISGKVSLPENKACEVKLLNTATNAVIFAGPLKEATTFRSQVGDAIDYYFFYGPELDGVVAGYRQATGQAPMFPKWAFGFWQCRERYTNQQHILEAATEFRKRKIPVDVIVQDWMYWGKHGWGAFDFDEQYFPKPAEMIKKLHDLHYHYMISTWSKNSGAVHDELKAANGLMPRGSRGQEWHDAFSPVARNIRWQHMKRLLFDIGADAWWMDATEPETKVLENFQVYPGSVNRFVNAYPLFANEGVYEGQRAAGSDKRVCILTRSAYPGLQRYAAACWSGDVGSTWDSFRRQIAGGLNFCMTGIPYWTTDIGGFFRPDEQFQSTDFQELLIRWFEFGTFCPILRIHGYKTETEMWKWPAHVEQNLRYYDNLRYRLLPYIYSTSWQVTSAGGSMMRALPFDFRGDTNALNIADQYMFGPAFLVCPVTQSGATERGVYLPAGPEWYDFWTGEKLEGGWTVLAAAPRDTIPAYVRAGSIVPMGPLLQYASEKAASPIELRVYRGADGAFTLYEDEGDNYNYEGGAFATIPITWNEKAKTLTIGQRSGKFKGMLAKRTFKIVWVKPGQGVGAEFAGRGAKEISYKGQAVTVPCPE